MKALPLLLSFFIFVACNTHTRPVETKPLKDSTKKSSAVPVDSTKHITYDGNITRTYNKSGKLESERCRFNSADDRDSVIRTYYENGKVNEETFYPSIDETDKIKDGCTYRFKTRMYSEKGGLTEEQTVYALPDTSRVPEYNLRLVHDKTYKNRKLSATGDYYTNDIEGDRDSTGIWKIYDEKGQCKILKFNNGERANK